MPRAWIGHLAFPLFAFVATSTAACGSPARMPKGPPPEYEEHDAGTPIFEGQAPASPASPAPPGAPSAKPGATESEPLLLPAPPSPATPRAPAPEKR
ncbi:hypothetical protein [Pendulispora albinea]|uniref:Lipoprotein n=1 Tax=Pendulispora albinea TaxID=2741071 RepID=A0ABZ2LLW1_9BACT